MRSARYFCPILIKFGFCQLIFIEVPIIKFHGNPPSVSRSHVDRRTDGNDEAIKHLSRLCDPTYKSVS